MPQKVFTSEDAERALELLRDGASFTEVGRSLGFHRQTISDHFPNMGWSLSQAAKFGRMIQHVKELDTNPPSV